MEVERYLKERIKREKEENVFDEVPTSIATTSTTSTSTMMIMMTIVMPRKNG